MSLSTDITGLNAGTAYRWVFCASPNDGGVYACSGPNGTFGSTTADPPPDYATFTTSAPGTLSERWDGTHWTIQPTPNPSGAQSSSLAAVSCTSATACTAVGDYANSAGTEVTLAEVWDGTSWTIQRPPNPSGAQISFLSGVSCTSAAACTAVGGTFDSHVGLFGTLAERWDGTTWTIQKTPNLTPGSRLSGVSCTSPTACTAVGSTPVNPPGALAERWDGTTWAVQTTANLSNAFSELSGTSCTSATACQAVGSYTPRTGPYSFPLAEGWDGTTWTLEPTQAPGSLSGLVGASCTSAAACTAVGLGSTVGGFAERWDGTTWTIQTPPSGGLNGVSCTSITACTAVGTGGFGTLAEAWDGTTWTIQPTPNPTGTQDSDLLGVSCTSATACTAVGRD